MIDYHPSEEKYSEILRGLFKQFLRHEMEGEAGGGLTWEKVNNYDQLIQIRSIFENEILLGKRGKSPYGESRSDLDIVYFNKSLQRPMHKLHFEDSGGRDSRDFPDVGADYKLKSQSRYHYRTVPGYVVPHPQYKDMSFEVLEQLEEVWLSSEDGNLTERKELIVFRLIPKELVNINVSKSFFMAGFGTFTPIATDETGVAHIENCEVWRENTRAYFLYPGIEFAIPYERSQSNQITKMVAEGLQDVPEYDQFPNNLGDANILVLSKNQEVF